MLKRVIYREDGGISIQEKTDKSDDICAKLKATHPLFKNCTWGDIDEADLPVRDSATRDKWRRKPGPFGGVFIDDTVIPSQEARAIDLAKLKTEKTKPVPDLKTLIDLVAKLQENNY